MTKSKKAAALVRLLLACPVVTARAAHIRRDGASKASVELAVMSMCPDAVVCEQAFAPVLKSMSDQVDLSLSYIGTRDERGAPACMHGAGECEGNVQQLCAHRAAKGNVSMLMDFVLCQGEDRGGAITRARTEEAQSWTQARGSATGPASVQNRRAATPNPNRAASSSICEPGAHGPDPRTASRSRPTAGPAPNAPACPCSRGRRARRGRRAPASCCSPWRAQGGATSACPAQSSSTASSSASTTRSG
ncbi:unnamed protein product [Prorocentrum cordatum]|uniref:Uncharacterized protein n=1 Tax=Prorocentrum cordatum TaxID=2364126 RepID=A0ABN9SDS2_9DINO|nr:unnamed protein product [Polarella glacialis]